MGWQAVQSRQGTPTDKHYHTPRKSSILVSWRGLLVGTMQSTTRSLLSVTFNASM